jgi:hypothetical protein
MHGVENCSIFFNSIEKERDTVRKSPTQQLIEQRS